MKPVASPTAAPGLVACLARTAVPGKDLRGAAKGAPEGVVEAIRWRRLGIGDLWEPTPLPLELMPA